MRSRTPSTILGEVGERAGQPVDFVDHRHIDQALIDVHPADAASAAGRSIVPHRQTATSSYAARLQTPSFFASLAPDERFARLALCLQRVEVLFQSFLRRLAGVDCAATTRSFSGFHDFAL